MESWGKSLITGEMETVFKREGKGLLSRLAFRKAPVSKSQENIMFPKIIHRNQCPVLKVAL